MPTFIESLPASTKDFFVGIEGLPFQNQRLPGDVGDAWFCAEASELAQFRFLDLAHVQLPDDALADHAPSNYTTKLRDAATASRDLP